MQLINMLEEIMVKMAAILSAAFHVNYEPVKVKKIPELSIPEVRKARF